MTQKKSFFKPIVFMILLSAILTFILAFVNDATYEKIVSNTKLELMEKILYVFDIDYEKDNPDAIIKTFDENIKEEDYNGNSLFIYEPEDGEIKGYAVPVNGPGLWGSISGYLGINSDFTKILGVDFTKQDETPGLGGRIEEEDYKSQYRDLDISDKKENFIINNPAPGGNIDAISGATQTSTFVVDLINKDLKTFIDDMGGAK